MKTTKILLGALRVSALIALFAVAMPAEAQTVNFNFNGNGDIYTGLGAAPDLVTDTHWNSSTSGPENTPTTFTSLLNSAGGSSNGVAVTLDNPGTFNPYDASVNKPAAFANPLLSDQFYASGTITLSGLTAGGQYDLYLYSQNGGYNSDSTTFTFGTSKNAINNATGDLAFTPGVNYVEFALTADGSGDIVGSFSSIGPGGSIDGLQIQAEAPVEAPEPSSLATMSLVGMALLMFCKRLKEQSV